jgi:RimJ/RimL family protein N-acetyltransferase
VSEPILMLRGEKVGLGPIHPDLVPLWTRWVNDLEVTRTLTLFRLGPLTQEFEQGFYDARAGGGANVIFAVYELEGMQPIGTTGIEAIDYADGKATFGILIGEKAVWNRGYGTEATRLTLDYAFNVLGLHNVMLIVYSNNPRAQRAYEKAGFKVVGRRRGSRRVGDQRYDEIYMDALAAEFDSPLVKQLVHPA